MKLFLQKAMYPNPDSISARKKLGLKSVFIVFCLLFSSVQLFAQTVQIKADKMPIAKFFSILSKQTGYELIYDDKIIENAPLISINIQHKSLREALDICFKNRPFQYFIKYKTVVITKSSSAIKPQPSNKDSTAPLSKDHYVKGLVLDTAGHPLQGVSVSIKGSQKGVLTDDEGAFMFDRVSADDRLVFSFVGFLTTEMAISDRSAVEVHMHARDKDLAEVVVVGYATQKKVDLTGSVSTVSGKLLASRPVGQTSASLEGTMPGVTVTQSSGKPGGDAGTIRIRGIGTLSNASPLVLIDGVEGSMDDIDANMIASVSVLKDAASASIYGSRAANGVILVTTKRGVGKELSINYNDYFGWQNPTELPDLTNALEYMQLTNVAYVNAGRTPLYAQDLIDQYKLQGDGSSDSLPNTDWQKAVLTGSGFQQSHFLTVNGGSDHVKMLLSMGYFDQKGLIPHADFRRLSIRSNTDIIFSKKLNLQFDLQFLSPVKTEPAIGADNIFAYVNNISPNQLAVNANGTVGEGWIGNNPAAAAADGGIGKVSTPEGSINATLNYQPLEWLTATFNIAPKYIQTYSNAFNKVLQTYHPDGTASYKSPQISTLNVSDQRAFLNNMRGTLNFHKRFGAHNLNFLAGTEENSYHTDMFNAYRDGYVLPDFPVLSAGSATNMKNGGSAQEWSLRSFFGRLNYNYREKYLLEVNSRYDGSSRFAEGRKWGYFPSVSAGWRISEEPFLKSWKPVVDELKLRASWGRLGNQNIVGAYPSTAAVNLNSYTIGGQIVNTAELNDLANKDITWEQTEMSDIGVDMELFSHLSITADYYIRKTRDILLLLNIPLIIGLNAPYQNAGKVNNKGWDLALNYNGNIDDFKYNIGVSVSDVHNEVIDMHGINQSDVSVSREGYPINSIFGYEADGFFKDADDVASHAAQFGTVAPGDIKYKDQNGDGIINESDKVILGNTIPRYTFGANINASWKGFDLGMLLQGVGKVDGLLYGAGIMPFYVSNVGGTAQERFKDYWTPDNPDAAFPRLVFGSSNNQQISSFWMKSASYFRLKNIQLGYTLPERLGKRIHAKSLRLFVNGSNIFTLSKFWKGYDVETPVGTANNYPVVKVFSFGVNVTF